MSKPVLYGPAFSTYTRSARLAMEEKGVEYELVAVDFLQGPMPPEQIERQPFAKVPAFEHDGFSLYEASAIMRYVDEAFDGPRLQPDDTRSRARMNQILGIIDSYTYPPTIVQLVIQRIVMPMLGEHPDESAISAALPEVAKSMGELNRLRGDGPYLAGGELTLADLHLAPIYEYFQNTPDSASIRRQNPGLEAWWQQISARDSMRNTPFSG